MKQLSLCIIVVLIGTKSLLATENLNDAFNILSHADRLESSALSADARRSKLAAKFVVLAECADREHQFELLAKTAVTNSGKAYGILGLYRTQPDGALRLAMALPADFKVAYMLFCITGEWRRDEFIQELKKGDLLAAVMRPVTTPRAATKKKDGRP